MQTIFYTIAGVRWATTDTGGNGEVVLLMHGWPDNRQIWRKQLNAISDKGYRVISVDWPAHGDSQVSGRISDHSIPNLCKGLNLLMEQIGEDKYHLVAHDYGAAVCWEFAMNYPARLHSYCALSVGPSVEIIADMLKGKLWHYHWLQLHGMDWLSRKVYLRNNAKRYWKKFASHQDAADILKKRNSTEDQTFWTIWEKANPATNVLWRWLKSGRHKKVQVPTLGIYSTKDEWMTEGQMKRAGRHVKASWQFETLDCGHWLQLEKPSEVSNIIVNWLSRHVSSE